MLNKQIKSRSPWDIGAREEVGLTEESDAFLLQTEPYVDSYIVQSKNDYFFTKSYDIMPLHL